MFKKVHETARQRFYKLSEPVLKAPNKRYDFEREREYNLSRLKDKYKHLCPDKIEYVCVSDANTHVERLLFLAFKNDDGGYGGFPYGSLDGKNTFMIHGGDMNAVYPDKVYLRRLASANGFDFKIEIE